jgi:cytochrome c oxidase assembly factor CtaG
MPDNMHEGSGPILVTLALVVAGLLYFRGWIHLRSWRSASFFCGLLSIWLAAASSLAMLDAELLTFHMVQHILLMTIAPPLILLGSPFRFAPLQRLRRIPTKPVFCWFASTAVLIGWHIPAAFALGGSSGSWHLVEHATFFGAGLLFWWPVIPSWSGASTPRWSIVLYLFLATLPCDGLSAFLAFCGRVVYASYLDAPRRFNLTPLQDQECAGALMWTCATFAYLIPAVLITTRLLSTSAGRTDPVTVAAEEN